ncbi:hypothetical protein [Kaistella jeonii]|uniref:Uncharacterized protein n=1 Tax=Kaistella jeonii TaxID=266749 RepID=A0A0C1FF39_9FLAO|nr:hypothetical protein [Kaistella jeonii]KIA90433.1 hypothetical protein OA86_00580 [Kaistella jeonii]SFB72958.1 hypothetical protein SAMN05421876_101420 [Kaistella jeonii]VEI95006.1 Uncharacterised protein [Kaistella jeonii]
MKKIISVLAITACTFAYSQETPKKDCCAGKDKKECSMEGKKTSKGCDMKDHKDCKMDGNKTAKACDMKNHKDCKMDCKEKDKREAKKVA